MFLLFVLEFNTRYKDWYACCSRSYGHIVIVVHGLLPFSSLLLRMSLYSSAALIPLNQHAVFVSGPLCNLKTLATKHIYIYIYILNIAILQYYNILFDNVQHTSKSMMRKTYI